MNRLPLLLAGADLGVLVIWQPRVARDCHIVTTARDGLSLLDADRGLAPDCSEWGRVTDSP